MGARQWTGVMLKADLSYWAIVWDMHVGPAPQGQGQAQGQGQGMGRGRGVGWPRVGGERAYQGTQG